MSAELATPPEEIRPKMSGAHTHTHTHEFANTLTSMCSAHAGTGENIIVVQQHHDSARPMDVMTQSTDTLFE